MAEVLKRGCVNEDYINLVKERVYNFVVGVHQAASSTRACWRFLKYCKWKCFYLMVDISKCSVRGSNTHFIHAVIYVSVYLLLSLSDGHEIVSEYGLFSPYKHMVEKPLRPYYL